MRTRAPVDTRVRRMPHGGLGMDWLVYIESYIDITKNL